MIDNSQYVAFTTCPWYWYEKYVIGAAKRNYRSAALSVGSAVHQGIEQFYKTGSTDFRSDDLLGEEEMEVRSMLQTYAEQYRSSEFDITALEDPLYSGQLMAKLDGWFHNPTDRYISGGVGEIFLPAGVYGFEHKTRGVGVERGAWMKMWEVKMQAAFQLLTLQAHLATIGAPPPIGILVNVIDKPTIYVPRKTCKGCDTLYPVPSYTQLTAITYQCSACGHVNTFKGTIPQERVDPPVLWRMLVTRSKERLDLDEFHIKQVLRSMDAIRNGEQPIVANREACVNPWMRKQCEFFEAHAVPVGASDHELYQIIENPFHYVNNT